ncbi:hypothetical protein MA16_Dca024261 [Dendrobium catenatum]|uniref:Uncharacterized protein n=1 Tax=Dendrobium catenatum TaxID=906689 RepID=A0A2I0WVI3_9ASPA|nr:hypothetical protein MA16_Dca024261 [Dendrobium catenatum]
MTLGNGSVELRPLNGGPVELWCQVVVWRRRRLQVVVQQSNDVWRWSGRAQVLKWWSGRTLATGCCLMDERASSDGLVKQRR